jgi:hypothetical protein
MKETFMTDDLRAQERRVSLRREEWITKFVNAVVRELRPGLDRMVAVAAAREAWLQAQEISPFQAAQQWVSTTPAI